MTRRGIRLIEREGLTFETFATYQSLTQRLVNPFKNYLIPPSILRLIFRVSKSELLAESQKKPGGWKAMEIIYRNAPPRDFFDKMAVTYSPFALEIRNRRVLVVDRLEKLIRRHGADGREVLLLGVGSGPGRKMQEAMAATDDMACRGVVIELDDEAFDYGRRLGEELGTAGRVEFIQGDAREIWHVLDHQPDIVELVGLFDYLDDTHARGLLEAMHEALAPGGSVLATSVSDVRHNAPFLKRMFGWDLHLRTGEELAGMMRDVGFDIAEIAHTPMEIYGIVTGRKGDDDNE